MAVLNDLIGWIRSDGCSNDHDQPVSQFHSLPSLVLAWPNVYKMIFFVDNELKGS